MPTECSSQRNRISWLILSKAHDKSSNTSIVVHFLSSAVAMSFFTRMSAVSVEWPAWYADWNGHVAHCHRGGHLIVLPQLFQRA